MYVAITKITEHGQPIYCVNPVETTLDFSKAFKFLDQLEIQMALRDAKENYDLTAFPVEIIETRIISSTKKEIKKELQVI
jgi:hypothetical protein